MLNSNYKFFVPAENKPVGTLEDLDTLDLDLLNPADKGISSSPFIVNVLNATGSAIYDVKVLGANANLLGTNTGGAPNNYGNPLGIQISMGIGSISYPEFLMQTQTQPFTVGLTYLFSSNANQVLQTYALQYKDANGNLAKKYSIPTLDPYQSKNNIIPVTDRYTIDGEGMIILNKLFAGASVSLYLYPTNEVIVRRTLANLNPERRYGNPDTINQQPMVFSKAATEYLLAK